MSKYDPDTPPHTVYVRADGERLAAHPHVLYAKPRKDEVYRLYIGGDIKVRKLNSGVMQVATGEGDWMEV